MKRGIIHLSNQDLKLMTELLTTAASLPPQLIEKFSPSNQSETTIISTDEDELELLLDQFPAPSPNNPLNITQLREKLTTALTALRSN